MRSLALLLSFLLIGVTATRAEPLSAQSPGLMCRTAIAAAEQASRIPPQLMAAIGRVESGRQDAATGAMHPWPWTVDAEGQGRFYDTKAQAVAAVRALQARGVRSIDVGCMQVNLMHHPDAFATLEDAFDPTINAGYAARLLGDLHAQTNDWPRAVALYHSATPDLAAAYERKVLAVWPDERRLAGGPALLAQASPHPTGGAIPGQMPAPSNPGRMVMGTRGPAPLGRDLAAYRVAPILLATRPPHGTGG